MKLNPLYSILLAIICLTIGVGWHFRTAYAQSPTPNIISISSNGDPGNAWSDFPTISANGRFIAFASDSRNLVPGDTNNATDIFVHDRQTGNTNRISISSTNQQANAISTRPSISANGRFVAFESLADNLVPGDSNNTSDIFIYDRLTGTNQRISISNLGEQANNRSESASISADGRYVAFLSLANNLIQEDTNGIKDVFLYDRMTNYIQRVSVNANGEESNAEVTSASIASDGRTVVYSSRASNLVPEDTNGVSDVFVFNRVLADTQRILINPGKLESNFSTSFPAISAGGRFVAVVSGEERGHGESSGSQIFMYDHLSDQVSVAKLPDQRVAHQLSGDGRSLVIVSTLDDHKYNLSLHDLQNNQTKTLVSDIKRSPASASYDGSTIVYVKEVDHTFQVILIDQRQIPEQSYTLAGRITDNTGYPLASVTLADNHGNTVMTDRQGYYFLGGIPTGNLVLTPSKDGYRFDPPLISLNVQSDSINIDYIYTHEEVLVEAKLDIGMPYSYDRGCDNPWNGCGGAFHGFHAGYCTDLILDAYSWGVDYNIQFALEQDFRAHPEHFYRWRDSRNAHDMWRFFSYTGQMLDNNEQYQPGDMVFFDWSDDGEIDHVSIVSEINSTGNPKFQLDATGVINSNPSGLAAELVWESFHDATVRGHARWSGVYESIVPRLPGGQMLQIALGSPGARLRLLDDNGNHLSRNMSTIPEGVFFDLAWEEVINIHDPYNNSPMYTVEIVQSGDIPQPYQITAQTMQNSVVTDRTSQAGIVDKGQVLRIPIQLKDDESGLTFIRLAHLRKIRGRLRK